jgi:VWFA-related protein
MNRFSCFPLALLVLVLALIPHSLLDSQASEPSSISESINVDLVDLYISAVDKKGRYVPDLKADELTVRENGVIQQITHFESFAGLDHKIPLTLSLVLDSSASMDEDIEDIKKLDMARDAGLLLINELGTFDRMQVVTFHEVPTASPFTADRSELNKLLQSVRIHFRHTALFDAIDYAIDELNKESGRKVLMICSDGQDNLSKKKMKNVLEKAVGSSDLTIIVLGTITYNYGFNWYGATRKAHAGKENLQTLANQTGGYAFFPENRKQIAQVQELIRSFVRSQYSIAYRSTNPNSDGSWRQVTISSKRKGVNLRYREGYFAR